MMNRNQWRYVRQEAAIGAAITAVLSLAFTLVMFGGAAQVPVFGAGGLIVDAIPQNFFGALMCVLVPTVLTRKRLKSRQVAPAPAPIRLPAALLPRALLLAVIAATMGTLLALALLAAGPSYWPFLPVVAAKMAYGALLGGVVGGFAVRVALGDAHSGRATDMSA
jgi:hypothetical protein